MEYLLIISIAAMGILGIQDSRTQKLSLLQNIKKSCSIDSVWFEKALYKQRAKVFQYGIKFKKGLGACEVYTSARLKILRQKVRHSLDSESAHDVPSVFIQKMKSDKEH